jgi:hypothetical protein
MTITEGISEIQLTIIGREIGTQRYRGPVQCSPASRAARFRCPRTPSPERGTSRCRAPLAPADSL